QWWWALVIQAGGFFTGGYLVLVLAHALAPADEPVALHAPVPRVGEAAALTLAGCSLLVGLGDLGPYLPAARATLSNRFGLDGVFKALWPILGGAALAILLGRWGGWLARISFGDILVVIVGRTRRLVLAVGGLVERIDGALRQWPAAA